MLTQGTRHCNLEPAKGRETGLFFRPKYRLRSSQTPFVLCVTTMKRAKATIGTLVVRKTAINSLIPRHC
jgi:hypothetical protein